MLNRTAWKMAEAPDYVVSVGPNHYANGVAKTKVELKGNPKQNGRREAAMVTLHRFILAATAALALITPPMRTTKRTPAITAIRPPRWKWHAPV
jgi:hypothetical protein